jgi:outer membrane protein assembly complex protein YaeT
MLAVTAATSRSQDDEPRLEVESVVIEGNEAFSDGRLHKLMVNHPSGFWFFARSWYRPETLDDDLRSLERFYRQQGYLEARVADYIVEADSARREVYLRIRMEEGTLTLVENLTITGSAAFNDSLILKEHVALKVGEPYEQIKIQESKLSILSLYANAGYLEAAVDPEIRVDTSRHRVLIDFLIEEGPLLTVDSIIIQGLEKSEPFVVRRELLFSPGDTLRYNQLLRSQRRLYLTTLFSSVFIRPRPAAGGDPAKRDVDVELREVRSIQLEVAAGYGTEDQVRGRVEVQNRNLFGTGRRIGVNLKASFIERNGEVYYIQPWTLGTRWQTQVSGAVVYREEPGFDTFQQVGRLIFSRKFTDHSTTALTYRLERDDLRYVTVADYPSDLETNTSSLNLSSIWDTRNDLFNATRGLYVQLSAEYAGGFLGGTADFVRPMAGYKFFQPFESSTIIATAGQAGWISYFGKSNEIPLDERFFLGGPTDLRGFGYRLVGPLDAGGTPTGGNFLLAANLIEIRKSLWKYLGLAGFADVGSLWPTVSAFRLRDLRVGAGPGLRANTPIGIIRLDWGINVRPRGNEDPWQLYVSVGQAF